MPTRVTIIFYNPVSPEDFEALYDEGLTSAAKSLPGVLGVDAAKVWPKDDGSPTPAYRILDMYFESYESASAAVASKPAAQFFADIDTLATNGFMGLFSDVE